MSKTASIHDSKLCITALRLAALRGWEKVTLEQIAKAAKIPFAPIKKRFADTHAILPLIVEHISAETFKAVGKPDRKAAPRDRLFEILMARFDILQTNRKAILSIAAAAKRDPRMLPILVPAQIVAMKKTISFAGLDSETSYFRLAPLGLWSLFLAAFCVWRSDEMLDMSRTMAALDRYLRYANHMGFLFPG